MVLLKRLTPPANITLPKPKKITKVTKRKKLKNTQEVEQHRDDLSDLEEETPLKFLKLQDGKNSVRYFEEGT